MRYCPTGDGNQVARNVPKDDAPKKRRFMHSGLEEQSQMRLMMMIMASSCICLFSVLSSF